MATNKKKKVTTLTKSQLASEIAERTGLTKAQIQEVFAAQAAVVGEELKAGNAVKIPDLVKVTLKKRAATPARAGKNPFTGEPMTIKAKPARRVVRVSALKALKEVV